ncbi:MAG: MinD/ParA family protein [Deltaproteobacteria bacterium]|nr:MinD/ParA family protein [Deltaproteobacteria bacterium]
MLMNGDQAETLRAMSRRASRGGLVGLPVLVRPQPQVIAVVSGKGGVGKTNLVANLAIAFARTGSRVLALDGDIGTANLDLALGVQARGVITDVLSGAKRIEDALTPGPEGLFVLPASSGEYDLANLSDRDRGLIFDSIEGLSDKFDVLLIDCASGIGANAVSFGSAAQRVLLVASPEPTSLADAYATVKVLSSHGAVRRVQVVASMVSSPAEGEDVFRRLCVLADRFLDVSVEYLGALINDPAVPASIRTGVPLLVRSPASPAAIGVAQIARKLALDEHFEPVSGAVRLFWRRVLAERSS